MSGSKVWGRLVAWSGRLLFVLDNYISVADSCLYASYVSERDMWVVSEDLSGVEYSLQYSPSYWFTHFRKQTFSAGI